MIVITSEIRITFVLFTNLGVGAGTEKATLALVNNLHKIDKKLVIVIIQTDYMATQTSNTPIYDSTAEGVRLITLRSPLALSIYEKMKKSRVMKRLYLEGIYPLLYLILNYRKMRWISKQSDIIYFVKGDDVIPWNMLFGNLHSKIINSGMCEFPSPSKGWIHFLKARIIRMLSFKMHFLTLRQASSFGMISAHDFILSLGVDSQRFKPNQTKTDTFTQVLYVSRLDKSKGVLKLIEAFHDLRDVDWLRCTIVGSGELEDFVSSEAKGNVRYIGFVQDMELQNTELQNIYAESDVLIFPAQAETFGLVVLEAASSGLFCLVSSELKGIFDDLENIGCLKYIETLPECIRNEIIALEGFKVPMDTRMKWHDHVKRNYDWSNIAQKLYAEIIETVEINGNKIIHS